MAVAASLVPPELLTPVKAELSNGLRVRLLPDPDSRVVSVQTFFRVGSRDERPGRTGIAHLFEHLMFNGATKYGPKEFDRAIEEQGGSSNAYTSNDVTVYHEEAPAEALELLLDLEFDRMGGLALSDASLAAEREVVKEERRLRVEDSVMGLVDEELQALVYREHPYRWPVIGWPADLDRISLADCRDFFARYYAPTNATLVIAGGFDPARALAIIERDHGRLPRGPPIESPPNEEGEQRGARRAVVRHPSQAPLIVLALRAPAAREPASAELDLLQAILSFGDGSLLVRDLVHERGLVTEIGVDYAWRLGPAAFEIVAELPPGGDPERVLREIWRHLERLAEKGPSARQLSRAKLQSQVALLRELSSVGGRAHSLGSAEILLGGLEPAVRIGERSERVTLRSAREAARATFRPERSSVVFLEPLAEPAE